MAEVGRVPRARRHALVAAIALAALGWVVRVPGFPAMASPATLYWFAVAAQAGGILAAVGVAARKPQLAWWGAGVPAAMAILDPGQWPFMPVCGALVFALMAWHRAVGLRAPRWAPPPAWRPA